MMATLTVFMVAVGSPVFDVVPIPLPNPEARVFPVDTDGNDKAEIAILTAQALEVFDLQTGQRRHSLALPEGLAAFDIFDADADGLAEVIAIQGGRVLLLELGAPESNPRELFRASNLLDRTGEYPTPHALGIRRGDRWLVAIPRKSALELRELNGDIVETHPLGGAGDSPGPFERPFMARTVYPNLVGPPGAVEMHIDQVVVHEAVPGTEESPRDPEASPQPDHRVHRRMDAEEEYWRWPWFPLRTEEESRRRVLYSITGPDYEDTLIRIEKPETDKPVGETHTVGVGPARRYRGSLIPPWQTLPDFNGDGYTDLLLWVAPQPGRSIDAVTRALTSRSWPLELRVQCFDLERARYEPRSAGVIGTRVPIWWFVHPERGMPLHLALMGDFNGDDRTDLGFATDADVFCAWTYDDGFPAKPSFRHAFPENLLRVETWGDLDGTGRVTAVLRGGNSLYILRPTGKG
jgi:hypothetical protein